MRWPGASARGGDVDVYALPPAASLAGKAVEIVIAGQSRKNVRLCLGDSAGNLLQCREGVQPRLGDIVLKGGSFVFVSGTPDPASTYELTARIAHTAEPDFEAEPNDTAADAMPLVGEAMRGRFVGSETDMFLFRVEGPALAWRAVVEGATVGTVELSDAEGHVLARTAPRIDAEGKRAPDEALVLDNVVLGPGEYSIALTGTDGDYRLQASSGAPPQAEDLAREREPNDSQDKAELLGLDDTRLAELSSVQDTDTFRLSLRTVEWVEIRVEPGSACAIRFDLNWNSSAGSWPSAVFAGQSFVYPALLDPGDYLIMMRAQDLSCTGPVPYRIGIVRSNATVEGGDVEPNDSHATARPVPADLKIAGTVGQFSDEDWFRLPKMERDTAVAIRVMGDVSVALTDGRPTSSFMMSRPTELASGNGPGEVKGVVPAGFEPAIRVAGHGTYALEIEAEGLLPAATATTAGGDLALKLELPGEPVAAFWHRSQRIEGSLELTNTGSTDITLVLKAEASDFAWHPVPSSERVLVRAGASETVPISVDIDPDAFAEKSVRIAVLATADGDAGVAATATAAADAHAAPRGDHLAYSVPEAMRGGFDIAWTALGARQVPSGELPPDGMPALNDGLTSNAGLIVQADQLPLLLTTEFGGERTWPVLGFAIHPQVPGLWAIEYPREFDFLLSANGTSFDAALSATLTQAPREQTFLLPQAREARAAQLRIRSNHDGNLGRTGLSEWKAIVDPAATRGLSLDLADPSRGGHVVWSKPLISDQSQIVRGMLEQGNYGPRVKVEANIAPAFVLGFHENRAAAIAAIEWIEGDDGVAPRGFGTVKVEASTDTPLGPWISLGQLAPDDKGVATRRFDTPVWARFLRFSAADAAESASEWHYPTQLRVMERPSDDVYRSILGEWGQHSSVAIYESLAGETPDAREEADGNDSPQSADPLAIGETVAGSVEIDNDEDWYRIVAPDDRDMLVFTLGGEPVADVDILLTDEAGGTVSLDAVDSSPHRIRLQARVEPGRAYLAQIRQPPHSVVIAYDTSGSLLDFIPIIFQGLEAFVRGVTPGEEAVNFLPFDGQPMLPAFSDQPAVLKQALVRDARESTTSGLETTMVTALRLLAPRRGTRAVLVISDASSSGIAAHGEMWNLLDQVRPRVFAAHIGSWDDPMREKQLLQDIAMANGGHYVSARSQAELDVAFDRVAAWLRRPARYSLSVEAEEARPPEPGALLVVEAASDSAAPTEADVQTAGAAGALEIVFDASGSMLKRMEGMRRIEIARGALSKLARDLPREVPVALRVFGHDRPGSCETALVQAVGPLDPDAMAATVSGIEPQNLARTPIAASLREVKADLAGVEGRKTVVLLTDGEETCGGDPRAEIAALAAADIEVRVNIVGFAVEDEGLKAEFREWARIGRGSYFDAAKPADLEAAVSRAARLPYRAFDRAGKVVAEGLVGGDAVPLPAGSYRVEVTSTPPSVFENVTVREGATTRIDHTRRN